MTKCPTETEPPIWKTDTSVLTNAVNRGQSRDVSTVLKGKDIVCFSHDWTGLPLSKTHFMRLLAKDNRILWVNSIGLRTPTLSTYDAGRILKKLTAVATRVREVEPNIFVLNPLAIPTQKPMAKAINRRILRFQVRSAMRALGMRRPVNWIFNPAAAIVARALDEELLIYHCVDEYTAFDGVSSAALAELEHGLLRKADIVIVSAEKLYETKSAVNPRTVLVRHGVDFNHFRKALSLSTEIPREIADLPRPVIGYFGLIATDWVDVRLLVHVARSFPDASLVMLGNVTMDVSELARLPNVRLLGRKPYETLPNYCKGFDVALIPFPINQVTLHSNPLKAREYLAAGLPVVSTAIPEVRALPTCQVADSHDSFVAEIKNALHERGPKAWRSDTVRAEGWDARLEEIRQHLSRL